MSSSISRGLQILLCITLVCENAGFSLMRHKMKMMSDATDFFNRAGPWDDKNLNTLLTANYAWRKRMVIEQPKFFEEIKRGHAPKILWIGCSDARVPANEIIGQPPGSLFVHRNVANMVVNTDSNVMSVIQYGVDYLQVKHIIVCGHYDCGGVKAALTQNDHKAPLENWLRNIRDTYRIHRVELDGITDVPERQRRLVELNVVEQVSNWH
jgi:carbonic anhydrase